MAQYKVFHEPTAGCDVYEGKYNTLAEAMAEAEKHYKWAIYWNKALYIKATTGETLFLHRGER